MTRSLRPYLLATCIGLITIIVTLYHGAVPWDQIMKGVKRCWENSGEWNPLLHERIPRLIILSLSGAALAVSGAVMQALFQNPLASPSVLGISSGGSIAVLIVLVTGLHLHYPMLLPLAAMAGCLTTLGILFFFSSRFGNLQIYHLLLTGIALSTLLLAIKGSVTYALRNHWQLIQTIAEWDAGSSYDRSWLHVKMLLPLAIIGLAGCWTYRNEINILTLGEEEANNLGVSVNRIRWRLFTCIAMLTGGSLAALGTIAFFGLILPHLIRRAYGPDNRQLIPLCTIWGAIALSSLDLIIRMASLHYLSIGNISAVLGGVFFVTLLLGQLREPDHTMERW